MYLGMYYMDLGAKQIRSFSSLRFQVYPMDVTDWSLSPSPRSVVFAWSPLARSQ